MKKTLLSLALSILLMPLFAQLTVTGNVSNSAGDALIGVNVWEKGTTHGTVTDYNGNYRIMVSGNDAILVYTYTGYGTAEINVSGRGTVDLVMSEGIDLSEVQVVGSRSYRRSSTDSPVGIDIIDIHELSDITGKPDINQILQYSAPSFNATKQSGADGADHIDPASLRGLGPDQTLVLINGKRHHQSSLINVFGTRGRGNTGTDLNALPAAAIKRIEILRDGSSAQYGSDAIAGVINIVLQDRSAGVTGGVTYGAYSTSVGSGYEAKAGDVLYNIEGKKRIDGKDKSLDGNTWKMDLNYGTTIGDKGGFANFTTEFLSQERTLRPSWSWRKGYGSAAVDGFNFMVNSSIPITSTTEFYAFGGRNFRQTDAYAFSRSSFADGDNRSVPSLYPNGFTPHITSEITDVSACAGIRHAMENGWIADFSNTYGRNNFHYYITGTNNASLQDASPTNFDAGGHNLSQDVTNLDFSKYFEDVASGLNLAYGLEYRTENFQIFSGEEGSYALYDSNGVVITNPAIQVPAVDSNGDQLPGGSQGFPGYSPDNVVNRSRSNFGLYVDGELNATDAWLVGGALRYEKYSDFGSTFNFKVDTRYAFSKAFSLRGSVSTGFRAPSLAQIHYNLLFNNIVGGQSLLSLLSSNTSTVTKEFGIGPLKEEKAVNASVGLTYSKGGFLATVDFYSIAVDDRIVLTDNFDATGLGIPGVEVAQFFANGVDTRTSGADIVLGYKHDFDHSTLGINLAGNFNNLDINKIHNGNLNYYTFFGPYSQAFLKAAAPDYKVGLNIMYSLRKFDFNVTLTQFSKVTLQDDHWLDTPATTQAESDALILISTDVYKEMLTADFSIGYRINKNWKLTIGANNAFNTYPTPQFDGWTDQGGFSDSLQMGNDGAYYFARLGFNF
ncbi:MAG TPA: TonB-dependent receptor [Saprospiraceae bacterium]|nr:TonB-dependent receptor [Saprospiraceae bacterium]